MAAAASYACWARALGRTWLLLGVRACDGHVVADPVGGTDVEVSGRADSKLDGGGCSCGAFKPALGLRVQGPTAGLGGPRPSGEATLGWCASWAERGTGLVGPAVLLRGPAGLGGAGPGEGMWVWAQGGELGLVVLPISWARREEVRLGQL